MALKLRRGTDAQRLTITPEAGEPLWIDDTLLYIGDGTTQGGVKVPVVAASDLAALSIDAFTDVKTTGAGHVPSDGQTLIWHESMGHWMPGDVPVGDVQGSVFGDDSTLLVDGVNGLVTGNINSVAATVKAINNQNIEMANVDGEPLLKIISETNTGSFGASVISINNSHTGTYGQEITFNRSNGTNAVPTAAASGDYVGSLSFRVHDGNDYTSLAAMHVVADTVTGTDDVASKIDFYTRDGAIASEYNVALSLRHKGVEATGYVKFGSYTTAERNALTPAFGMVIYNTTTNIFEGYQNTSGTTPEWVALS